MPVDLAEAANAQDLAGRLAEWIRAAGCERGKRLGLLEAWPR